MPGNILIPVNPYSGSGWRVASLLAAMALTVSAAGLGAQGSQPRRIYASVVDKKGAPVTNVGPNDLVVREDGVAREILKVEPATEPMRIALLVDNSQAATRSITFMRDALNAFAARMTKAGHSVSLVTLGDRPTLAVDATTDAARLKKNGIDRLFALPGSGMYLLEAIIDTAKGFSKNDVARPVMVAVVTEGQEFSNAQSDTVVKAIKDAGASFHAVVITEGEAADIALDEVRQRNIVLDRGPRENGGSRILAISNLALKDRLDQVATELLAQVAVTYASPDRLIPAEKIAIAAAASRAELTARGVPVKAAKVPLPER